MESGRYGIQYILAVVFISWHHEISWISHQPNLFRNIWTEALSLLYNQNHNIRCSNPHIMKATDMFAWFSSGQNYEYLFLTDTICIKHCFQTCRYIFLCIKHPASVYNSCNISLEINEYFQLLGQRRKQELSRQRESPLCEYFHHVKARMSQSKSTCHQSETWLLKWRLAGKCWQKLHHFWSATRFSLIHSLCALGL